MKKAKLNRPNRGITAHVSNKYGRILWVAREEEKNTMDHPTIHDIESIHKNYEAPITGPNKKKWIEAIKSELNSLHECNTFKIVTRPKDKPVLKCRWVFKKKQQANGSLRFKGRLVVKGYEQQRGINYFNSFAPTLNLTSLRLLVALASRYHLNIHQIDITTAYLYSKVDCEIYMEIPTGFKPLTKQDKAQINTIRDPVTQLLRGLYGLVQSGYLWHTELKTPNLSAMFCIYLD